MPVKCQDPAIWKDTPFSYYFSGRYFLPHARRKAGDSQHEAGEAGELAGKS